MHFIDTQGVVIIAGVIVTSTSLQTVSQTTVVVGVVLIVTSFSPSTYSFGAATIASMKIEVKLMFLIPLVVSFVNLFFF